MKKEYVRPSMSIEVFEASEYVSSCIQSNVFGEGRLWAETNGIPGLQTETKLPVIQDLPLGDNICMEIHKFDQGLPEYKKGYWKPSDGKEIDVYYWRDWSIDWKYHVVVNTGDFTNSTTNAS